MAHTEERLKISVAQKKAIRAYYKAQNPKMGHKHVREWFKQQYHIELPFSTISNILSSKFNHLDSLGSDYDDSKRCRPPKYPDLEVALAECILKSKNCGFDVSGSMLLDLANNIWQKVPAYRTQQCPSFSGGWVEKFKIRHKIKARSVVGEAASFYPPAPHGSYNHHFSYSYPLSSYNNSAFNQQLVHNQAYTIGYHSYPQFQYPNHSRNSSVSSSYASTASKRSASFSTFSPPQFSIQQQQSYLIADPTISPTSPSSHAPLIQSSHGRSHSFSSTASTNSDGSLLAQHHTPARINDAKRGLETLLATISNYLRDDVFTMSETLLAYNAAPTAHDIKEATASRMSLGTVTVALCYNASGTERLTPWVVGHHKAPASFAANSSQGGPSDRGGGGGGDNPTSPTTAASYTSFPSGHPPGTNPGFAAHTTVDGVEYSGNNLGWMTMPDFRSWLRWFDEQMTGRNVLLVLDPFKAHEVGYRYLYDSGSLQNVKVMMLPGYLANRYLPPDLGAIYNFKAAYRKDLLVYLTLALQNKWEEVAGLMPAGYTKGPVPANVAEVALGKFQEGNHGASEAASTAALSSGVVNPRAYSRSTEDKPVIAATTVPHSNPTPPPHDPYGKSEGIATALSIPTQGPSSVTVSQPLGGLGAYGVSTIVNATHSSTALTSPTEDPLPAIAENETAVESDDDESDPNNPVNLPGSPQAILKAITLHVALNWIARAWSRVPRAILQDSWSRSGLLQQQPLDYQLRMNSISSPTSLSFNNNLPFPGLASPTGSASSGSNSIIANIKGTPINTPVNIPASGPTYVPDSELDTIASLINDLQTTFAPQLFSPSPSSAASYAASASAFSPLPAFLFIGPTEEYVQEFPSDFVDLATSQFQPCVLSGERFPRGAAYSAPIPSRLALRAVNALLGKDEDGGDNDDQIIKDEPKESDYGYNGGYDSQMDPSTTQTLERLKSDFENQVSQVEEARKHQQQSYGSMGSYGLSSSLGGGQQQQQQQHNHATSISSLIHSYQTPSTSTGTFRSPPSPHAVSYSQNTNASNPYSYASGTGGTSMYQPTSPKRRRTSSHSSSFSSVSSSSMSYPLSVSSSNDSNVGASLNSLGSISGVSGNSGIGIGNAFAGANPPSSHRRRQSSASNASITSPVLLNSPTMASNQGGLSGVISRHSSISGGPISPISSHAALSNSSTGGNGYVSATSGQNSGNGNGSMVMPMSNEVNSLGQFGLSSLGMSQMNINSINSMGLNLIPSGSSGQGVNQFGFNQLGLNFSSGGNGDSQSATAGNGQSNNGNGPSTATTTHAAGLPLSPLTLTSSSSNASGSSSYSSGSSGGYGGANSGYGVYQPGHHSLSGYSTSSSNSGGSYSGYGNTGSARSTSTSAGSGNLGGLPSGFNGGLGTGFSGLGSSALSPLRYDASSGSGSNNGIGVGNNGVDNSPAIESEASGSNQQQYQQSGLNDSWYR